PARRAELADAGLLDEVDERRRAAVHDWHLGRVELDRDVVDALADQGREQVLDRLHGGARKGQPCGVVQARDVLDTRRNLQAAEAGSPEANPEIGGRWTEGKGDSVAGVEADPGTGDGASKGPLRCHSALVVIESVRPARALHKQSAFRVTAKSTESGKYRPNNELAAIGRVPVHVRWVSTVVYVTRSAEDAVWLPYHTDVSAQRPTDCRA